MPPDERGRPAAEPDGQQTTATRSTDRVPRPGITGCPCGCLSRWMTAPLGFYRDPDCAAAPYAYGYERRAA